MRLCLGTKSLRVRYAKAGTPDGEQEMEQNSSSQYPRALIVEDETMIALGLEAHLRENDIPNVVSSSAPTSVCSRT